MKRTITSVLGESIFIGLFAMVVYLCIAYLVDNMWLRIFLIGSLTHLLFEFGPFGNVNKQWCDKSFPK